MAREIINEPAPPFSRLPNLLEKLYETIADFFEAKLALFRKELWEEGESLVKRTLGLLLGALVAWAGFLFVSAGLVMAINGWLHNPVWSSLIVGFVYVVGGGAVVKSGVRNLRYPLPKTQAELEKDKQWIGANT